jgi:hypothetical protein
VQPEAEVADGISISDRSSDSLAFLTLLVGYVEVPYVG